mmetsp:Transcript_11612/g.27387  ORF Transcript_11612/g.27387 Transcript_11612/m.27387 type:complete len:237 (+) Transcript_11612:207-917(+)
MEQSQFIDAASWSTASAASAIKCSWMLRLNMHALRKQRWSAQREWKLTPSSASSRTWSGKHDIQASASATASRQFTCTSSVSASIAAGEAEAEAEALPLERSIWSRVSSLATSALRASRWLCICLRILQSCKASCSNCSSRPCKLCSSSQSWTSRSCCVSSISRPVVCKDLCSSTSLVLVARADAKPSFCCVSCSTARFSMEASSVPVDFDCSCRACCWARSSAAARCLNRTTSAR